MKWAYTAIWLTLLTALSLAPLWLKDRLGTMGHFHTIGHFLVFAATAIFVASVVGVEGSRLYYLVLAIAPFVMEGLEVLIYHPPFEWNDVASDAAGVAAGLSLLAARRRFKRQQRQT